jgi:hypothetical protein
MSMELDDLPPDPRSALLGLIGSTFAELKNIDNHLITKSNSIAGIKTDLNRLVAEANQLVVNPQPAPTPSVQPPPPVLPVQPVPVLEPAIATEHTPQPTYVGAPADDPNQLLLDFYRKLTPEDINSRLAEIDVKLLKITNLLHELIDKK